MDDGSPELSVGFAIETGGAFAEILRFAQMFDDKTAEIVRQVAAVEAATGGMMKLSAATAEIRTFGSAASRELRDAARETGRVEKAGEAMVRQLERQNAAFGKTREEMRGLKAEAAALAAEQQGLTELAGRIRDAEGAIFDKELAAARKLRFETEALGQEREQAAQQTAAGAALEAKAIREAAHAHAMFEAAARRGTAAYRERQAAENAARSQADTIAAAAAAEQEAQAIRSAALAYQMFEAAARRGSQARRESEEVARSAAAAQEATAVREAAHAYVLFEAACRRGTQATRDAEQAARDAAAAQAAQDASLNSLRSSVDPLFLSQQRLSRELESAVRLYRAGAIGQEEYERASSMLAGRLDEVQRAQARANSGASEGARDAALRANDLVNIMFQVQDIFVSMAGGQNPFLVLIQQGSQLGGIMAQTGLTAGGMAKAILGLLVVSTPTAAAMATLAAAEGAVATAQTAAAAAGTRAAIATAELAIAEEVATAAGLSDAAAQHALALAQAEVASTAAVAGAASRGLAAAQAAATTASTAAAASATLSLAPVLAMALPLAAALGAAGAGVAMLTSSFNDDRDMKEYAKSLGLTQKEISKLGDVTITFGDTTKAIFQVIGEGIWNAIGPTVISVWETMKGWIDWIAPHVKTAINFMNAVFYAALNTIKATWSTLPAAMGDIFMQAVNASIDGINWLIRKAVAAINGFIGIANVILDKVGLHLPELKAGEVQHVSNQYAGAAAKVGNTFQTELGKTMKVDYLGDAYGRILDRAASNARTRIKAAADAKGMLDADKAKGAKAAQLSEEERAFIAANKAARDYAAAQQEIAAKMGLSAKQLRLYADAAAIAAAEKAGVAAADIQAIRDAAAAREAAYTAQGAKDFDKNVLQPLRDELALYGLVGTARAAAALELEKSSFLATNGDDGPEVALQRWQRYVDAKRALIARDDAADQEAAALERMRSNLDAVVDATRRAGDAFASAFGRAGAAIGDAVSVLAEYHKAQTLIANDKSLSVEQRRTRQLQLQVDATGDMISATKGLFKEHSAAYRAMAAAEKAYRAVQLAMSIAAIVQNALETAGVVAGAAAKATAEGAVGVAKQSQLPFPANIAAMAATAAALVAAGIAIVGSGGGGGRNTLPKANDGTGTVLGDATAKSESINRALDQLRQIDTLMLTNSRQMLNSLRSIDNQIGGLASVLVRSGRLSADDQVATGFEPNAIGSVLSKIPLIGGILGGLFGTKTSVLASGIYAGGQSIGDIIAGGFDAQTYSDIQKKKKFLGLTTSTKYSTVYGGAIDGQVGDQFALILKSFNDAILAAAGPLGVATSDIAGRVSSFVFTLGKIDLKGLTGTEIQEKLTAVFGAAADSMASAAFPGIERFQKVGEGAFETLVRVASTVETVTAALDQLGNATGALGIDAKMALADQFDSLGDLSSAIGDYFDRFYTPAEQNAARLAQLSKVFVSMNLALPETLAGFRALVDAQDLNTEAGRAAYATLLQLAPAFADLKASMDGAKSAADILGERQDLQRKLLELAGDTAAIRALDLAKLDASNRALQMQVWAVQDAQEAAKAAQTLADAWTSVGTSIGDEIKRIRGLAGTGDTSFAALQGQFNAATTAARGGDMDAAKLLPGLSQSLLKAAGDAATSRQELARVQAMTAASLEATNAAIAAANAARLVAAGQAVPSAPASAQATSSSLLAAASASQATAPAAAANDDLISELAALREEVRQMRSDNNAGHAANAGANAKTARILETVSIESGGDALKVRAA